MGTETVTLTGPADGATTDPDRLAAALAPHARALGLTEDQIPRAAAAVCKGRTTLVAERLDAEAAEALMDEAEACGCRVTIDFAAAEPAPTPQTPRPQQPGTVRSMSAREREQWLATGVLPTAPPGGSAAPRSTPQSPAAPPTGVRCQTCGSGSVARITIGQRAASGLMGGLVFGKKARASFQCRSCGYVW